MFALIKIPANLIERSFSNKLVKKGRKGVDLKISQKG